jgi:NhaP-type Na+/H+ and K+/H+ antiporter
MATLGALADIYGLQVAAEHGELPLADYMAEQLGRAPRKDDIVVLGPIALLAHAVDEGRVSTVGLRLPEPEAESDWRAPFRKARNRWRKLLG